MNNNEIDIIKKYQTYMKSAQGSVGIALIMTLVYVIRALLRHEFDFFFCTYTVEFLMKKASLGKIPIATAAAVGVVFVLSLAVMSFASQNNGKLLYGCLILYGFDSLFLVYGCVADVFSDFSKNSFIDILFHIMILVFIVSGIYAYRKILALAKTTGTESEGSPLRK